MLSENYNIKLQTSINPRVPLQIGFFLTPTKLSEKKVQLYKFILSIPNNENVFL